MNTVETLRAEVASSTPILAHLMKTERPLMKLWRLEQLLPSHQLYLHLLLLLYNLLLLMLLPRVSKKVYPLIILIGSSISLFGVNECSKGTFMTISRKRNSVQPPQLILNDTPLEQVETFKYLGVLLSSELSWSICTRRIHLHQSIKTNWSALQKVLW